MGWISKTALTITLALLTGLAWLHVVPVREDPRPVVTRAEYRQSASTPAAEVAAPAASQQVIVRFRTNVPVSRQHELLAKWQARVVRVVDRKGEYAVELPVGTAMPSAPEIEFSEPDYLFFISYEPNDPLYANYSGSTNDMQKWIYDADNLNAEAAWDITRGSTSVVIAIIDTGVALQHPDLAANIWTNPGELDGNGVDDDGNGYIDDIHGWDCYNNDNDPNPDLGDGTGDDNVFHGTMVAGCAAAVIGNGIGIAGACPVARIMPLKVFTSTGGAPSSAIAAAIRYAADNGANVINMSFSGNANSRAIATALLYAWSKGVILVAAAGNGNSAAPNYPAAYPIVISVGGTSGATARAPFTQFGRRAVDVVAPAVGVVGPAVYSATDAMNGYGAPGEFTYFTASGTSFSSPIVAGEAALLVARAEELGLRHSLSNADIANALIHATTDLPDDPNDSPNAGPDWDGNGRVDFLAAVTAVDTNLVRAPVAPRRMAAAPAQAGTLLLLWTDDTGNEEGYRVERATFVGGQPLSYDVLGIVGPNVTQFEDATVVAGATYFYRIVAFNLAGETTSRARRLTWR